MSIEKTRSAACLPVKRLNCLITIMLVSVMLGIAPANAQHASQVETDQQRGDHFSAMLNFDKIPKRKINPETRVTVAKSAWALSLPEKALYEFEQALVSTELPASEQQIARLSQAIIHLQEQRPDQGLVIARKLAEELPSDSALNAKVQMLIGNCLIAMGLKTQAEEHFALAFTQASYQERSEVAFQLGELLSQLGRWDESESYLKTISQEDDRAIDAQLLLLEINFNNKKYAQAEKYLSEISSSFPESLKTPWIYYVRGSLAVNKNDQELLNEVVRESQNKLAPSDPWLNMLQADYELFLARSKKEAA